MDKKPIRKAAFARFTKDLLSLPQLCSRKTTCVYRIKRDGIHLRKRIKKRILKWRRQNSRSAQYV